MTFVPRNPGTWGVIMTFKLKTALLTCAGFAAIAVPVSAGHNTLSLRGFMPAQTHTGEAYVPPQLRGCNPCAPTWQTQRLQQRVVAQPAYVTASATGFGLRGFSNPNEVRYSRHAAKAFQDDRTRAFNIGGATVRTSAMHSDYMLDRQENVTGKALTLLTHRQRGVLASNSLYIGAGFEGGLMWQKTSEPGQFPLLSRFPFFSDRTDDQAGVFAINSAALSFTSTFGDWTTLYLQPEYSETEYGSDQDEFQLRKAYVVFGNLDKTPFYAAFGRKTIDFGNFNTYTAFTHSEGQHYFQAVSDQPVLEVGYYRNGLKLTASALSAGRQLRVALAGEDNNLGNYAFNAEKEFLIGKTRAVTLGGGYLHDTIYRDNFTAHTFQGRQNGTPPANFIEYRNSAVSAFAEYNSRFFDAMVEYTTTLKPWGAIIPQDANGNVNPAYIIDPLGSPNDIDNISFDEKLSVLVAQARIKPMVNGRPLAIAATGSWGNIGDDFQGVGLGGQPTTWKKNQQHALSLEYPVSPYLDFGAEYVYNKGFIPFVAPQLVSNDQTEAHAINVGFKARF